MLAVSNIDALIERLDQFARDQKARDEGLRQAFHLLIESMKRMQAVVDDIHAAATREPPKSGIPKLLEEIKELLTKQPEMIAEAIETALKNEERTRYRGS